MSLSMYRASGPVFVRGLSNLSAILEKAAAHAEARKIDQSVFMAARLAPDMFAFPRQVQIASDTARTCVAKLAGIEPPAYPDTEASFDELKARIAKSIAFIKGVKESQIEGSENRNVIRKVRGVDTEFKAPDFLFEFAFPNFFFHVTAAYAILRHNGVEVGKRDFLG